MKTRTVVVGSAVAVTLAFSLGFALGQGRSASAFAAGAPAMTRWFAGSGQWTDAWSAMDAMHDSPQMRAIHEHVPPALQAQCDAMHEQMQQWIGSDQVDPGEIGPGMMGGSGMMGPGTGSGMMGW